MWRPSPPASFYVRLNRRLSLLPLLRWQQQRQQQRTPRHAHARHASRQLPVCHPSLVAHPLFFCRSGQVAELAYKCSALSLSLSLSGQIRKRSRRRKVEVVAWLGVGRLGRGGRNASPLLPCLCLPWITRKGRRKEGRRPSLLFTCATQPWLWRL